MKTEPALIVGAVMSLVVLAVAFGVNVTQEQQDAIEAALNAVLNAWPYILAILTGAIATRQSVVAPATVEEKYDPKPGVAPAKVLGESVV